MKYFTAFRLAIQFMTRIPVGNPPFKEWVWGLSTVFFPWVGLLIGGLLFASHWALVQTSLSVELQAAVLLFVGVAISGGLHLDGLADTADAWMSGKRNQDALVIMSDSHIGTGGVLALVGALLMKWLLLVELMQQSQDWMVWLVLMPMLARWTILPLFLTTHSAKTEGLAVSLHRRMTLQPTAVSIVLATGLLAYFLPWALLGVAVFVFAFRAWLLARFDGFTGDHLGAMIELSELLVLSLAVLVLSI